MSERRLGAPSQSTRRASENSRLASHLDGADDARAHQRPVRYLPDALRVLIAAAAVVTFVASSADEGWYLVAAFAVAASARGVALPWPFDLASVVAVAVNGAGNAFGLFKSVTLFDETAHLLTLMLISTPVYVVVARVAALPTLRPRLPRAQALTVFTVTASFGMALGLAWELIEWGLDAAFATNLSLGYTDTLVDLALGTAGALIASAAAVAWGLAGRPR